MGVGGYILAGGEWWIYFGWWWVVVDIFWLVVSDVGWWWVVVDGGGLWHSLVRPYRRSVRVRVIKLTSEVNSKNSVNEL